MSGDVRAATTPKTRTGTCRYRLRMHELAPVLLPRARAASLPAERRGFNAVVPTRPRGSIVRVASPCRGRPVLESVAFDPFSGSECFKLLLQSPETSSKRRQDPRAVAKFRQWLSQHFPQLVRTLRTLGMIDAQAAKENIPDASTANQCNSRIDEEETDSAEDEQGAADCDEAWRLMLRRVTMLSAAPGETIATQSIVRAESVYFLLNGHCELSFRLVLLRDEKMSLTASTLPRMSTDALGFSDHPIMHLRELAAGDCFGLDAAAFGFEYLLSTVTAGSACQRNFLGLREAALTYVLCLPYLVVQQLQVLQRRHQDGCVHLPPAFPYSFAPEAEVFLRNTFLFRSMAESSRRFLAAHLSHVVVAQQEYLFTPGQPVRFFIVISGQLTLGAPREERPGVREEADLELEILQAHDSVGLAEVLFLTPSFERYCAVTSPNGARAYALPSTVLLMVLAQESPSLKLIHEWIAHRKSWFELRRATALAQRKKFTAEGCEHAVRLTLAAQRRSKLTCSRCGWAGHVSTSSSCVRVDIPVSESAASSMFQLDKRGWKSREGSRAARQQARQSHTQRRSEACEVIPVHQQLSPTSPARTAARRRLQVDSIALRALQVSRVSIVDDRLQSNSSDSNNQDQQYLNPAPASIKSPKGDAMRICALTPSLQRLEAALLPNETPSVQQGRR